MTSTKHPDISQQENDLRKSDPDLLDEERSSLDAEHSVDNPLANTTNTTTDTQKPSCPFHFVPLRMGGNGRTHMPSPASKALLESDVTLADLQDMTERFYEKAFADATIDKFIRSHDDPHGARFAKWIHQKLTGSKLWDIDRHTRDLTPVQVAGGREVVVHDRSSAHVAAWYSPKRPPRQVGRHFELDECRVWMRLHFWAMRESGIMEKSPSFADYYVRFIGHFVRVYEGSAPTFARDSLRWSANPKNIQQYFKNGRKMKDVLGLSFGAALKQIPETEAEDLDWPYLEIVD
jgi:hypothetical protein